MRDLKPVLKQIEGNERFQRLLAGAPFTAGIKSGAVILAPGESVGEHKTESREEAIVILEGRADVHIQGKSAFTAEAQSLVYIPPETNHDIKNNGDKKLRYVYVVVPVLP
ncbi:MAG: cupin domain-containing protein [Candidatus Omnitrophica bacterium]|jgi:mannose-6-phosphate isomerase-like protein (cupin superfamily)|nr:cupin domain-containing protein [Candidatus Omnitrophota bacterium]MDD5079630.1 cupin domain-containing protein [Candidatus Omnitrophota bacterium]